MNKERIKSLKHILCYMLAFLLATMGCCTLLNVIKPKINLDAANSDVLKEIKISNGDFNESTRTSYPYSPSGFNDYIYNTEATSTTNSNVKSGIINLDDLDDEDFAKRVKGITRDDLHDNYVLMIDSYDYGKDYAYNTNFGYRTSSSISLESGKNYVISVDAYTLDNKGIASLYLYNNDEVFLCFKNVKSYKNWTTYYFLVQTNNTQSLNLTLGMYLDGAGTVLYDNVSCHEISTNLYNSYTRTLSNNERNISLVDNTVSSYNITTDNRFIDSNSTQDSNVRAIDSINGKNGFDYTTLSYTPDNDGARNSALLVNNIKDTYIKYTTEDDFLSFKQALLYKVTVRAKATTTSSIQLIQTNVLKGKTSIDSKSITLNSSNEYEDYSFYINGHPNMDTSYRLEFALGSSDKLTSGKLYISNVTVSSIDFDIFSTADSNSQINLATNMIYTDSSIMLNNGTFDGFKINDYNKPFPATPINWTVGTGKNTQYYGVVNSESNIFSTLGISRPYTTAKNNNLLMMYNTTNDTLTYKSNIKTLNADSYHRFQIDVKAVNAPAKISLVTTNNDQEIVLSTITTDDANWNNVTMFIHAGYQDVDVALKVELTTTNGAGYVYLDNARFDYPDTSKSIKEQFESATDSEFVNVIDLKDLLSSKSTTPWSETSMFSNSGSEVVKFGIIPMSDNNAALIDTVIEANDLEYFEKVSSNVLGLKLNDGYQTIKSNLGYSLKSDDSSFYKISISLFTKYLTCQTLDNSDQTSLVDIGLTNFEDKFVDVQSNGEWTKYTFYIDPSSATTTCLEINVGDSEQLCSGLVFFGDIEFETIDKNTYSTEAIASDTIKVLETVVEPEDDAEDTNTESDSASNINWLYYIPSILLVLALLIGVIGLLARNIKWKKPTKKSKTAYDRNNTVSRQVYERKATTMRENKLIELKKELSRLSAERSQFEVEYKQNMHKLRELKIKRGNANEISKLEKEIKRSQRHSSAIGMSINDIEMKIKYTQSDSYMSALMKKLAREGLTSKDLEDTESK